MIIVLLNIFFNKNIKKNIKIINEHFKINFIPNFVIIHHCFLIIHHLHLPHKYLLKG